MDNSDDYFDDDDFVLDDAAEAAIAESERQYASQALPLVLPVVKKQRTTSGWAPGLGGRANSLTDIDFPEITVQDNGYYASTRIPPRTTPPQPPNPAPVSGSRNSRGNASSAAPAKQNWQAKAPSRHAQRSGLAPASHRPSTSNYQPHSHSQSVSRSVSSSTTYASKPSTPPPQYHMETQLQQLRQQLEELRQSNAQMQSALQGALDGKMSKEGEVTILRKTIEKNSQAHAAEVARLKAAKQEAETKQIQIQKTLKEDMERLRTQLKFKHQELVEGTMRKPPFSVRPKRNLRDVPATPMPSSSTGVRSLFSQRPNYSVDAQQTPSRPVFAPPPLNTSPKKTKSPLKLKKPVMLPGFQNSFVSSTPLRPSQLQKKGKEKEQYPEDANVFESVPYSQPFAPPFPSPMKQDLTKQPPPGPLSGRNSPTPAASIVNGEDNADIDMTPSQQANDEDLPMEDIDIIDPPNWNAELCRIILTHIPTDSNQTTFQQLLAVTFTGENALEDSRLYASAHIRIMNAISHPTSMEGYDHCVKVITDCFISAIEILLKSKLVSQLAILFNLLTTLVFYLPTFRCRMFGQDDSNTSPLIRAVNKLVVTELKPSLLSESQLGHELLTFLETMCFELSDDDALKFSDLVRNREVLMTLLNPAQPAALLEQVARTLSLLSMRKPIYWCLLSLPNPNQVTTEEPSVKNGLTERLCSYLVDSTRDAPEFYQFKESILTYFAQVSLAHPDAYVTLSGSPVFLASVIWHIAQLTSPLWEDDERLVTSQSTSRQLVHHIRHCIYFLHHLIFRVEPTLNLQHKLQQAPPRPFNNILQVFTVAIGRIGHADPPDWLDEPSRSALEQLLARDILELVVDGPEGDDIWNAFQEEEKHLDEEEMEAQMVETE